jgi:outer membrane protein assembly factor BamD (BamD/ComL family)
MKKVIVALMALVLVSCGGSNTGVDGKSEKELSDAFQKVHSGFVQSFKVQGDRAALKATADSLTVFFNSIVKNHPESNGLSEFYFAIGEVSMMVNDGESAVKYFDALESKYPESENVAKALYLKAHTYEDILTDTVQAIASYKHLYKTYPENEWSQNAKNQVLRLNNPNAERE